MASIFDSVILGPCIKCKLSLYRHDIKTADSQPQYILWLPENLLLGVRVMSNFWIGDWMSFRAGLQPGLEETVSLCWELNSTLVVLWKLCCPVLSFGGSGYRIQRFQWLGICIIVFVLMPPINPPSVHTWGLHGFVPWFTWEVVTGVQGIPCWELLWHMLANGALVYSSQVGRYHAEGCMALG